MEFDHFTHLTFDCYGTLIDWETGILEALRPVLEGHAIEAPGEEILRLYARHEAELEDGPYRSYRGILGSIVERMGADLGFSPSPSDREALAGSVPRWRPFDDTTDALTDLGKKHRLVILSNIDNDLIGHSIARIGVPFDEVITAEELQSYKPRKTHFEAALERLDAPRENILHVAQSSYHDHVPAKAMGFSTVRVKRESRLPGTGLSLPVDVTPDLEVPNLRELVDAMID